VLTSEGEARCVLTSEGEARCVLTSEGRRPERADKPSGAAGRRASEGEA
jgi:hypothetical protein